MRVRLPPARAILYIWMQTMNNVLQRECCHDQHKVVLTKESVLAF